MPDKRRKNRWEFSPCLAVNEYRLDLDGRYFARLTLSVSQDLKSSDYALQIQAVVDALNASAPPVKAAGAAS